MKQNISMRKKVRLGKIHSDDEKISPYRDRASFISKKYVEEMNKRETPIPVYLEHDKSKLIGSLERGTITISNEGVITGTFVSQNDKMKDKQKKDER